MTAAEMRATDAAAPESVQELIARAGWHVARRARSMLGGVYGRRVVAIAGPGNNGADARVAANLLAWWGVQVEIVDPHAKHISACDLVIDGAFGTGLNRPWNALLLPTGVPVLAVDIASGVQGDTGQLVGRAVRADHTVTFAALKPGLLLQPGAAHCGTVEVVDIGLDTESARAHLLTEADARMLIPRRLADDHKWKRAVHVVGGSSGMYGAPLLASRAALRSGSGMVWCGLPDQEPPAIATEVVFHSLAASWHDQVLNVSNRFGALVIGCGLGQAEQSRVSIRAVLDAAVMPTVIDGDGLRLLGENPRLRSNVVLTPHDGEYESLAGHKPGADRFQAARSLAASTGATVLLKGPLTIVARPDGSCLAANTGDQRLATAGTGDVLAGVIGSHLATGLEPGQAAALGAWIHGKAGSTQLPFGMVASDLVDGLALVGTRLLSAAPIGEVHAPY